MLERVLARHGVIQNRLECSEGVDVIQHGLQANVICLPLVCRLSPPLIPHFASLRVPTKYKPHGDRVKGVIISTQDDDGLGNTERDVKRWVAV